MSGRVPPSSRARLLLPDDSDIERAASLAQRFTGHDPVALGRVKLPFMPRVATVVGVLDGVLYTAVRDGRTERYIHDFARPDRPLLAVTPDARQLLIVGGGYRFTALGIVDDSDRKHRNAK